MRSTFFAFSAAVAIFWATSAPAATFSVSREKDQNLIITLRGEIVEGDSDDLKSVIRRADNNGDTVVMLRLDSPGGSVLEGVKLADVVRDEKIPTSVLGRAKCASACFMVFAAGSEKYVGYTAQVGVHGASDEHGRETAQSSAATISMARISQELGVPPSIIGKMVVTPPDEILWLTPDDLRSMGTTMVGERVQPPSGPAPDDHLSSEFTQPDRSRASQPKTSETPTWESLLHRATELSKKEHGGEPSFDRICQPELRECITGLSFTAPDGTYMIMKVTENMSGKTLRREVCTFNKKYGNERTCVDWDTGANHRDKKDKQGNWHQVDADD